MCLTPNHTSTKIQSSTTFLSLKSSTSTMPAFKKFISRSTAAPRQQDSAGAMPGLATKSFSIRKLFQKKAPTVKMSSLILDGLVLKDKEGSIIPPPKLGDENGYQARDMSASKISLDQALLPDHGTCQCCSPSISKPEDVQEHIDESPSIQTHSASARSATKSTKSSTKSLRNMKAKMNPWKKNVSKTFKGGKITKIGTL